MFKRNGVINMGKERYSILFSSMTGNTKELADAIREILPEKTLDYFGLCKDADPQSEILYIGFWTDKGTADEATTTLLKSLRNKKSSYSEQPALVEAKSIIRKYFTMYVKILIRAIR